MGWVLKSATILTYSDNLFTHAKVEETKPNAFAKNVKVNLVN